MDPEAQQELINLRNRMQAVTPGGGTGALDPNDPEAAAAQGELEALRADRTAKASAGENFGAQATEAGRAGLEGVVTLPEVVGAGMYGIANIPRRVTGDPLLTAPTPITNWYEKHLPPDPNFPTTTKIAKIAGPIAVTGAASGIANLVRGGAEAMPTIVEGLASLARGGVRTGVTTGGVIGGGKVGGDIGESLTGGEGGRTYGELLGSIIGGGVAPAAVSSGAYGALSHMLTDAGSGARLADALRNNIPISLGLIGNKLAGVLEDASVGIPFAGAPAYGARLAQYLRMLGAGREIAQTQRTGLPELVGPRQPIDEASIGSKTIDVAQGARNTVQGNINYLYDDPAVGLHSPNRLPRDTIVRPDVQRAEIARLNADPASSQATQGAVLRGANDMINADTRHVLDPAYETQLDGRAARIANDPTIDPATRDLLNQQIADERAANRGMSVQNIRQQRDAGVRSDTNIPLDAHMQEAIRESHTEALRTAAEAHGVPRAEFDQIEQRASDLMTQRGILDPIAGDPSGRRPPEGQAYTKVFGTGGERDLSQLAALNEHNPAGLQQIFADEFERQMLGSRAASTPGEDVPQNLRPAPGANWWASQPEAVKRIYGRNPDVRERAQALANTMDADTYRPTRTVPGAGGNTLGAPATLFQNPTFLATMSALLSGGGGIGGGLLGGPLGALIGAVAPTAIARTLTGRMTNPAFAARVVHPPSLAETFGPDTLVRMGQSTVGGYQNQKNRQNQSQRR